MYATRRRLATNKSTHTQLSTIESIVIIRTQFLHILHKNVITCRQVWKSTFRISLLNAYLSFNDANKLAVWFDRVSVCMHEKNALKKKITKNTHQNEKRMWMKKNEMRTYNSILLITCRHMQTDIFVYSTLCEHQGLLFVVCRFIQHWLIERATTDFFPFMTSNITGKKEKNRWLNKHICFV